MPEKDSVLPEEPTFPCKICGRHFIQASLVKHEPACKKLSKLNRKPFDSGKQRASGSDIPYSDIKRAAKEREKLGGVYPRPQTNWKERHETFIDAVSSSKKVDYAIKTGAPLPPPPRTAVPSDFPIPSRDASSDESCWEQDENRDYAHEYAQEWNASTVHCLDTTNHDHVQCDYCGRNFSESAAERHIPFCKQQNTRKPLGSPAKPIPTLQKPTTAAKNEERKDTSHSRPPQSRGRSSDSRRNSRGSAPLRQASIESRSASRPVESRSASRTAQTSGRTTTQSAGIRQLERNEKPVTPAKRSNSAPRTPSSRLKTPTPLASRMKTKW